LFHPENLFDIEKVFLDSELSTFFRIEHYSEWQKIFASIIPQGLSAQRRLNAAINFSVFASKPKLSIYMKSK
jgi:hypothetical protein